MEYRFDGGGEIQRGNFTSTKVAPTFQRVFPEVEAAVRMKMDENIVKYREKLFTPVATWTLPSTLWPLSPTRDFMCWNNCICNRMQFRR